MISAVNIHSSVAVYVQIENEIQFAIASGKLKTGDRLPSVREMSDTVGVNPNTVAKAYRDLEVMGLLYTRRGMGVFIQNGVKAQCQDRCSHEGHRKAARGHPGSHGGRRVQSADRSYRR